MLLEKLEIFRIQTGAAGFKADGVIQRGNRIPHGYTRREWEEAIAASSELVFFDSTGRETPVEFEEIFNDNQYETLCAEGIVLKKMKEGKERRAAEAQRRGEVMRELTAMWEVEKQKVNAAMEAAKRELEAAQARAEEKFFEQSTALRKEYRALTEREYVIYPARVFRIELRYT